MDVSNTDTGFTNTTSYNDVSWLVAKDIKKGSYTGKLYIPYSLVGKSDTYRINFFRIASNMSHSVTDWRCDMATCSYLAYNPTYNTTFHVPDKMVILKVSE